MAQTGMKNVCMKAVGLVAVGLGLLGMFLPLLPTTPFLLLAAALFFRSSPRLYAWLLGHRTLGPYIRNFREHKAIPLHTKVVSVSLVWITLLYCAFGMGLPMWFSVLLLLLAAAITWHILSYRTLKKC